MKRVIVYLALLLALFTAAGAKVAWGQVEFPSDAVKLLVSCGIVGGIGGVTYCMRGVYLNACVFDRWSEKWLPWYFLRPIVSVITGVLSCLFLQAGLIVLQASRTDGASNLVFFAFAFIAGLNVDKFILKIEEVAEVTWGIKMSRTATEAQNGSD